MTTPPLLSLPYDLLFLITQNLTDPCDLLALRHTHSTFNTHLKARFIATFENTPCTRPSSSNIPRKPTIDSMLFWAGTHNHVHFAQAKICPVSWPRIAMMPDGSRSTLTYTGMLLATCAAVRAGNCEVFSFLHEVGCASSSLSSSSSYKLSAILRPNNLRNSQSSSTSSFRSFPNHTSHSGPHFLFPAWISSRINLSTSKRRERFSNTADKIL